MRTNSELTLACEVKLLPREVRRVGSDGLIEGYASLFGVPDLGRDIVEPGAFRDSLARRGPAGIRMLWQHDPGEPVGGWVMLREDARGLLVRGRLNPAVRRAREIAALIGEGALDGLSIGFRVVEATKDRAGIRRLLKLDLWEISIVTFPMLPGARLGAVKGGDAVPLPLAGRGQGWGCRLRHRNSSRPPPGPPLPSGHPPHEGEGLSLAQAIRRASARLSRPAIP